MLWPSSPGVREQFDFPAMAASSVTVVIGYARSEWLSEGPIVSISTEYPPTRKSTLGARPDSLYKYTRVWLGPG